MQEPSTLGDSALIQRYCASVQKSKGDKKDKKKMKRKRGHRQEAQPEVAHEEA